MKERLISLWQRWIGSKQPSEDRSIVGSKDLKPCCLDRAHIAYRGVSDDRLYISYDRPWSDVKFFRPHGLRIFCAGCRKRLL